MLSLATAVLSLGFAAILVIAVLLGWGNLTWRALACERPVRTDSATAWLGFCVVSGVVEALHLFVAIDWKVTLVVGAAGLAGWATGPAGAAAVHALRQRVVGLMARHPWQASLLGILVLAWCLRAMAVPNNFDSGLYHFQSIRWINEEPIVFGLGNLHWRLALNQSYFGFLALLNLAPFWNKGYALGGICLLVLTLATLIETGLGQSARWRLIFGTGLLVFLGLVAGSIANPTPDNAVALLEVVIFLLLFRSLQPSVVASAEARRDRTVVLLLCVTVACVKFSSAAFALGCIAVLCADLLRTRALRRVLIPQSLVLVVILGLVHLARGFILSGAPFFPAAWLGAWQLEWAVPIGVARMETILIQTWAKVPGADFAAVMSMGWTWIFGWFGRQGYGSLAMLGSGLLLMLVNLVRLSPCPQSNPDRVNLLLYVPTTVAIGFWFLTAPDVRFLGAVLVLFFLLSVYLAAGFMQSKNLCPVWGESPASGGLAMAIFLLSLVGSARFVGLSSLSLDGWQPLPETATVEKRTNSGAIVLIPESGNRCWNAPVPCASLFNAELDRGRIFSHSMFFTRKPD